jgi:asparagine synthase (glutamine-hydrolysing)
MSFQFGSWYFGGQDPPPALRAIPEDIVSSYGPDGRGFYRSSGVNIGYAAFHTTLESHDDVQPHHSVSGKVITWDGRLDNRADLVRHLGDPLTGRSTDVQIAAAAYDRWGAAAFPKMIGDWALCIWDPIEQQLVLAKDVIGTRHLYWHTVCDHASWSTVLETIVQIEEFRPTLDEEYIAGWFSHYPAPHITPYAAVHSVSPGSFVTIRPRKVTIATYRVFDPSKTIRYRDDAQYEEHFRSAFAQSVRRRLRSDRPVLAELSGGMDSTSIVCMADLSIGIGEAETPTLDTLSFYDSSEPNWDERPFFTRVEETRGRKGFHIDVSQSNRSVPGLGSVAPGITPTDCAGESPESVLVGECLKSNGGRVVLSGTGGDEMMGGVPTPIPELADLLASCRFGTLALRLTEWGIAIRQPCIHLLFSACRGFLPPNIGFRPHDIYATEWLLPKFVGRCREVLAGYEQRTRIFGPRPSFQENLSTLKALQRQLACSGRRTVYPHEVRYPYLDQDLLEFLFAIPREQVIRPRQRRSLMRRALTGIVPQEILERKRKAFILRAPVLAIAQNWETLEAFTRRMVSEEMGIVNAKKFRAVLSRIRDGHVVPMVPVLRTLLVEQWVRGNAESSPAEHLRLRRRDTHDLGGPSPKVCWQK